MAGRSSPKREAMTIVPGEGGAVLSPGADLPEGDRLPDRFHFAGTSPEPDPDKYEPDDVAILSLLEELGGEADAVIRIYRQGKGGYRDLTFLGEMSPGEFTPTVLQEPPYNGGDFRLHIRGKQGMLGNRLIKVAPRPVASAPVSDNAPALLQAVQQTMMEGFKQMAEAMKAMIPPQQSRADFLAELQAYRTLFAPPPDTGNKSSEMMDMFIKGISLAKDMSPATGEAGTHDVLLAAVNHLLPAIVDTVRNAPAQAQPEGVPLAALAAPNPMDRAPAAPSNQVGQTVNASPSLSVAQHGANQMNPMMRGFVALLLAQAKQNSDPGPYAAMICDNVQPAQISAFIDGDEWFTKLCSHVPPAKDFPEWFAELREAIKVEMAERTAEAAGGLTEPGMPGDHSPDAAT